MKAIRDLIEDLHEMDGLSKVCCWVVLAAFLYVWVQITVAVINGVFG